MWHKDAIHVATAIQAGVVQLDTFDRDLIKMSGTLGTTSLLIGRPNLSEQLELYGEDEEEVEEEAEDEDLEEE